MMKRILPMTSLGLALLATAGCDNSKLTDVNKNPNAPETVSANLLCPTAAISATRFIRSTIEITPSAFVNWPQYMAEYQYAEISYYQFRPTTSDTWWTDFYAGPLQDFAQALQNPS